MKVPSWVGPSSISKGSIAYDRAMEEIQRTRTRLQQLEHEFLRAETDAHNLNQYYIRFDSEGLRQKGDASKFQQTLGILPHLESQEGDPSNNDSELLEAARAVMSVAGATPLMDVVDKIQALHGEIENISDILAQDLRHSSYELFQEELDRCHRDSVLMVGVELSKFLAKVSAMDDLNRFLIKSVVQIFVVSFCVSQWKLYFDEQHQPAAASSRDQSSRNPGLLKRIFLKQLIDLFKIAAWSIPGSKLRSDFEESLTPFFKAMDKTKEALDKVPKSAKVHLSVVGPMDIDDLTDSEICVVGTNVNTDSAVTPNEKLLQEFAEGVIIGTVGIGVYCSMVGEGRGAPRLRNLLPKKVIVSSAGLVKISDAQQRKQRVMLVQDGHDP